MKGPHTRIVVLDFFLNKLLHHQIWGVRTCREKNLVIVGVTIHTYLPSDNILCLVTPGGLQV